LRIWDHYSLAAEFDQIIQNQPYLFAIGGQNPHITSFALEKLPLIALL
jgi:hypothetical protein